MKNKLTLLAIITALSAPIAAQAETITPLACTGNYNAEAQLIVGRFPSEPNEASVELNFKKTIPEMEERIAVFKECLATAAKIYKGNENISGYVTFEGTDDVEIAETVHIYYDQKTKSVKSEDVEIPEEFQ